MPVPEIDRLAHEILDILGRDLARSERPEDTWSLAYRSLVTVAREFGEINTAGKPFQSPFPKRRQALDLISKHLATVGYDASRELKRGPVLALLRLYAALERAEMQERATPAPNLDADEVAALPLRGRPDNDMRRHQEGEGTR